MIDTLPAHDRQSYNDSLKALSAKFQAVRSQLSGKQKFSFKHSLFKVQKNESAISLNDAAELALQKRSRDHLGIDSNLSNASSLVTTPLGVATPELRSAVDGTPGTDHIRQASIADVKDRILKVDDGQLPPASIVRMSRVVADLTVSDMTSDSLQTLSLKDVSESIVICPKVSGPIHLTNISRSIIAVNCRQFRMHGSFDCDIYLHCTSRPIIEDCSGIRFAPLNALVQLAEGAEGLNLWSSIDDFKWLRADPSPNWSILPADSVLSEKDWTQITTGNDDTNPDTLLRHYLPGMSR